MPRLTPLRILLLIPLLWLTPFLLYVFLPFPQISQSSRAEYIQHRLTHGSTLTTVVSGDGFYEPVSEESYSNAFAIEWGLSLVDTGAKESTQLSRSSRATSSNAKSILLHIGKETTVNVSHALLRQSTAVGDYESAPFQARVIGGDEPDSKVIVPPWFPWAEGALFDSADHYFEVEIGLKLKVVRGNVVEVWTDPWFENKRYVDRGDKPLYPGAPRETGLLALFSVSSEDNEEENLASTGVRTIEKRLPLSPPSSLPRLVQVQHIRGDLLSRTFGIRQWLLRAFESPIFLTFYICYLLLKPREALEMSTILLLPLAICYLTIGIIMFMILRKVRDAVRKLFRMGAEGSGGEARGGRRTKLPVWMKDEGGVRGIAIGRRGGKRHQETGEEG